MFLFLVEIVSDCFVYTQHPKRLRVQTGKRGKSNRHETTLWEWQADILLAHEEVGLQNQLAKGVLPLRQGRGDCAENETISPESSAVTPKTWPSAENFQTPSTAWVCSSPTAESNAATNCSRFIVPRIPLRRGVHYIISSSMLLPHRLHFVMGAAARPNAVCPCAISFLAMAQSASCRGQTKSRPCTKKSVGVITEVFWRQLR